jgi:hypothetical protein
MTIPLMLGLWVLSGTYLANADLTKYAIKYNASAIATKEELGKQAESRSLPLLVVRDDLFDELNKKQFEQFNIIRRMWSHFEIFYILQPKTMTPNVQSQPST